MQQCLRSCASNENNVTMPSKRLTIYRGLTRLWLFLCLFLLTLSACDLPSTVTVNGTPVAGTFQGIPGGSSTPPLNKWSEAAPGVELRLEDWKSPAGNEETVTIVRFDLRRVNLTVGYQPNKPLLLSQWMQREKALAVINGGYFDQQHNATGLVISNGQVFGTSYQGFGGMLSVDNQGRIQIRYLSDQPYNANEGLQQATQSAPMLILPGGKRANFNADAASSRRSVVAMDKQGRLLFITSPNEVFTLDELADLLVASDLSINVALNLDGGSSTGLYVHAGSQRVAINSLAQLPIVIIVKPR
jgi:uncharacterized protein YigE (DUF2233 family)